MNVSRSLTVKVTQVSAAFDPLLSPTRAPMFSQKARDTPLEKLDRSLCFYRITEVYSPEGPRHTVGYPNETGGVLAFSNDVRIGGINGTLVGTMTGECVVGATAAPIANETNYICNEMLTFFAGEYANSSIMISGTVDSLTKPSVLLYAVKPAFIRFSRPL